MSQGETFSCEKGSESLNDTNTDVIFYVGQEEVSLHQDVVRLSGTRWLNDVLMNARCQDLCTMRISIGTINTYQILEILSGRISARSSQRLSAILTKATIFLPICVPSREHWQGAVIDMGDRKVHFYDPMIYATEGFDATFELAIQIIENIGQLTGSSIASFRKVPFLAKKAQQDGYNCGVHVLYIFHCFAGQLADLSSFNPDAYRDFLRMELLKYRT